jgi:hypothetical protein
MMEVHHVVAATHRENFRCLRPEQGQSVTNFREF